MLNSIIELIAGLGILLVGFKMLSDNIEKLANRRLKQMFNKTSRNNLVGVGIGALSTALIQSSAAATVMIVGFVNAGIMNLFQATAMIMGANIGTTITAQIVALGSFDFSTYAMLLSAIGMFTYMIAKKDKVKTFGLAASGLGLVFIALSIMQKAMTTDVIQNNEALKTFLASCNNPILLLLFGILFTALIQSSSAVTTILITMVLSGMSIGSTSNGLLFVILGSNIGTTITALLSSIGANPNAKRASLIHLLFNVSGALIFFVLLLLWPSFMDVTFKAWFSKPATQIAMFHTFFNVFCTLIFLPFIKVFVKTAELFIKDKENTFKLSFIDDRFLKTPSIAIAQASKETLRFGQLAMDTLSMSLTSFLEKDIDASEKINENLQTIENLNQELLAYLVKVSGTDITDKDEETISTLHSVLNDFYREAEIADNMIKYTNTVVSNDMVFSDKVYMQIKEMHEKLVKQFDNVSTLFTNKNMDKLAEIEEIEAQIDDMRTIMVKQHVERLERNECSPLSSGVFINLVSNLERAGDHLNYIAHDILQTPK